MLVEIEKTTFTLIQLNETLKPIIHNCIQIFKFHILTEINICPLFWKNLVQITAVSFSSNKTSDML